MALKNFTQFTPYTVLSATDFLVGYRSSDEIRTDLDSMSLGVSAQLITKGFLPGTTVGSIKRTSYRYTININSSVNAISGTDDNGRVLNYTPRQIEVYRNGSHLAESLDFLAINSTQITNLSTLNVGDIVEVVALSGTGATIQTSLSGFLGNILQQNYRYSVAPGNTITSGNTIISGPDDYGSVLFFNPANFKVYLNGSNLVRDYDFTSYNGANSITLAASVTNGDTVDVVSLSACFTSQLSAISAFSGISRINSGDRISLSTSTGSITVSSQTSNSDYPVSDWTNASHIARWGTLQAYLSGVAQSNSRTRAQDVYTQLIPGGGSGTIRGGRLHPNGKIYYFSQASYVIILDPESATQSTVTLLAGRGLGIPAGESSALAPNGRIYTFDQGVGSGTSVLVFDPSNNSSTTIGFAGLHLDHEGAILAPNGKIYCIPADTATAVIRIDPDAMTVTTLGNMLIGGVPSGGTKQNYQGGVLAPNGKIYCVPDGATALVIIDPATDTITQKTYANLIPNINRGYPKLAPNGKIYAFSVSSTASHAIIDPINDTVTTINVQSPSSSAIGYSMGTLAPNGKFYLIPTYTGNNYFIIFDPETNTQTTFFSSSIPSTAIPYAGNAVLTPSGKIVFTPFNATSYLVFNTLNNTNFDINVCTNPLFTNIT